MSTNKHIDKICCVVLVLTLLLTVLFTFAEALGVEVYAAPLGYENRLFSTDKVHTIDIVIDDWDAFLSTATSEEYSVCSVVIDGEAIKNVGIRGKGNTSLSSVSSMGSDRYSFKIEFDQYDNTKSYHGLDKLNLNNVIQDNTYMKDYLVYQMMNEFGVAAPLSSFVYIRVNGEDWGLYLAVEGVEDAFLRRNYGTQYGELYKPDSLSFGGGRGNGKDFDISDFTDENGEFDFSSIMGEGGFDLSSIMGGENFDPSGRKGENSSAERPSRGESDGSERPNMDNFGGMGGFGGGMGFGMGSSDVKLQYIDDDPNSYANIFDSAKTDINEADKNRLIASLKQLSTYENVDDVVDIEMTIRYFIVHNFVVNGDSYTGSMIHNYYLYEEDGRLSMIPWDYNLAFGTFQGSNASSSVNESISEVLSDRPMQAWIFSSEEYSSLYYELYAEFIESVDMAAIIERAYELIAPYVEKDPTAFCSYDEFEAGVDAITEFCKLRKESVALQLSGSTEKVDTGDLNISAMGTMGGGMGGFGGGRDSFGDRGDGSSSSGRPDSTVGNGRAPSGSVDAASGATPASVKSLSDPLFAVGFGGAQSNQAKTSGNFNPNNMQMSEGFDPNNMQMPEGFDPNNMQMPEGFDPNNMQMPEGFEGGAWQNGGSQGGERPSGNPSGGNPADTGVGSSFSGNAVILVLSVAVLVFGLVFAVLFKRRR